VNLNADLTVDGETTSVLMSNLSLGGAFMIGVDRLRMGTNVELTFNISTSDSPITTSAVVRWSTEHGVGVQFGGLRPAEVWSLNKFFENLL
jgi:hypothetical protein